MGYLTQALTHEEPLRSRFSATGEFEPSPSDKTQRGSREGPEGVQRGSRGGPEDFWRAPHVRVERQWYMQVTNVR
eukprot:1183955-Prorocentrum_minimum.AAC.1